MKTVLIYSGGLDSTTLLYQLLADKKQVFCLSVDYGQRHRKELDYASSLCAALDVEHRIADLSGISPLLSGSALTDPDVAVPDGHYTDESMKVTVVPNRNMIMLSIGIGWAVSLKCGEVSYAAHSGDHAIYPDCRDEFVQAVDGAARLCDWDPVSVLTPFSTLSKKEIVELGVTLEVPFEKTWSCYKGEEVHCGTCGTCVERREAFSEAGVSDPTDYL